MMAVAAAFCAAPFAADLQAQTPKPATEKTIQAHGQRPGSLAPAQRMMNQFEGIQLSDTQRQAIEQINQNTLQNNQANGANKLNRKAKKERRDSVKMAQRNERLESMKAQRLAYLYEIKQVLTPEQYAQFLENYYATNPQSEMGRGPRSAMRPEARGKASMNGAQKMPKAKKELKAKKSQNKN